MDITVDTITSSPSSLRLGLVVRGPSNSWVRFAQVEIPFTTIPFETIRDLLLRDSTHDVEKELDDAFPELPARPGDL